MHTACIFSKVIKINQEFRVFLVCFFLIPNLNSNFKSYSLDTVSFVLFLEDFSPAHSYESSHVVCSKRLSKSASVWQELSPRGISEVLAFGGVTQHNPVVYSPLPSGGKDLCWNFLAFLPPVRTQERMHQSE